MIDRPGLYDYNFHSRKGIMEKKEKRTPEELEKVLKKCEEEREEYLNGWKRAKADFINYKKEEAERFVQFAKMANETLVSELLVILDSFNLGLTVLKNDEPAEKGMRLIKSQQIGRAHV